MIRAEIATELPTRITAAETVAELLKPVGAETVTTGKDELLFQ